MPTSVFNSVRQREEGLPRQLAACAASFRSGASASTDMIHRMELQRTLEGHGGCVNTVAFNPAGDLLISGSDDQSVMLWDWRRGVRRLRFEPGHNNNVFQARMLPGTADKTLVSCAADGQVRVSYFREGSSRPVTKRLHRHQGRAHKLALQHSSPYEGCGGGGPPCLYSSGEDGDVCFFDLRVTDTEPLGRMAATAGGPTAFTGSESGGASDGPRRFRQRQVIDLNAVHVNPARPWQLVVGGADEAVVVYDNRVLTSLTSSYVSSSSVGGPGGGDGAAAAAARTRCQRVHGRPLLELCPAHLRAADPSSFRRPTHVTCVMFAQNGDVLATYNDDDIYLFRPPGTQGSGGGRGAPGSTGSDDEDDDDWCRAGAGPGGRRGGSPRGARAAGGRGEDDEEEEEEEERFLRPSRRRRRGTGSNGASAARTSAERHSGGAGSNHRGDGGGGADGGDAGDLVIGRYSGHRNNRTVKGVNFLGEREEWVVSGSDCGHVYIWCRTTGRLHAWLRGDSYVVNCLEPHPHLPLHLATSGIDDDIKLWAPTAEEGRPPGAAADATMRDNARQRSASQSRAGGGGLVVPRAVLRALLGQLARERGERDSEGDGGDRDLSSLLLSAIRGGGVLGDDEEEEEEEDYEDGFEEDDDDDEDGDEDGAGHARVDGGSNDDDSDEEGDGEREEQEDDHEEEEEDADGACVDGCGGRRWGPGDLGSSSDSGDTEEDGEDGGRGGDGGHKVSGGVAGAAPGSAADRMPSPGAAADEDEDGESSDGEGERGSGEGAGAAAEAEDGAGRGAGGGRRAARAAPAAARQCSPM